jgi:hypothetical protein
MCHDNVFRADASGPRGAAGADAARNPTGFPGAAFLLPSPEAAAAETISNPRKGGKTLMKNWKRYSVALLAVLALTMLAGGFIASNMGFKIVRDLSLNGDPAAQNWFGAGIPHNSPWADSDAFLADAWDGTNDMYLWRYDNAGTPPGWYFRRVYYYDAANPVYFVGTQFPIVAGEGYFMQITASVLGNTIVGSQDTGFSHPARTFSADPAAQNWFPVSITPNTTWSTSDDLLSAWFDGTNDLFLWTYDNAGTPPGWYFRRVYYYDAANPVYFVGTQFNLAAGGAYALEITANLGAQPQEPYY